jgi:predicted alpha/beta-fold hydrolase
MIRLFRLYFRILGPVFTRPMATRFLRMFTTPPRRTFREPQMNLKAAARESITTVTAYAFDDSKIGVKTYAWGHGARKALLLHGWAGSALDFGAMVNMLTDNGYEVISFDQRAHGFSAGKITNLIQWIHIIRQFLRIYPGIEIVIGHSLGGLAGTLALSREQQRVSHLVLIAPLISSMFAFESGFRLLGIGKKVQAVVPQIVMEGYHEDVHELTLHTEAEKVNAGQVLLIYDTTDAIISVPDTEDFLRKHPNVASMKITAEGHYRIIRDQQVLDHIRTLL